MHLTISKAKTIYVKDSYESPKIIKILPPNFRKILTFAIRRN